MVARDRINYQPKQPLWAQMPLKPNGPVADFPSMDWQTELLQQPMQITLMQDQLQTSNLPQAVQLVRSDHKLQIKVMASVARLELLLIAPSLALEYEFAPNVTCTIVEHLLPKQDVHNLWHIAKSADISHALHCYGDANPASVYNEVIQLEASKFNAWRIVHSGAWLHEYTKCILQGKQAQATIKALVLALPENNCQSAARFEHIAPMTESRHLVHMLVAAAARGVCFSDVEVWQAASDVVSEQFNKNLALAPSAEIFTQPRLCINNEQVVCSHGATTGALEPDKLRYMCARGLSAAKAMQLLIMGYANAILADSPENWGELALAQLGELDVVAV